MIIPAEEKFLRNTFGIEYDRYTLAVPRVCPRLTRWNESQTIPFNWGILAGEGRIALVLVLIYAAISLAAYLN